MHPLKNWYCKIPIRRWGILSLLLIVLLAGCGTTAKPAAVPEITPYPIPENEIMRADLYFYDAGGALTVESREVDLSYRAQGTYWQIVQALILGPTGSLRPVCPRDVAINSVMMFSSLAMVDIGETRMTGEEMERFRRALAETLYANAMAEYTLLTVNGRLPAASTALARAEGVYSAIEDSRVAIGFYKDRKESKAILKLIYLDEAGIPGLISAIGGENRGEYAVSPVGPTVQVDSYRCENGTAWLSLKGEPQDRPTEMGTACLALSLFYSTDSFRFERVAISYRGEQLSYRGKTEIIREDVRGLCAAEKTLYFKNSADTGLIPVRRAVSISSPPDEFWMIRQMLSGPQEGEDSDADSLFEDTHLAGTFLGGRIQGSLAILDFDRAFYSYGARLSENECRLMLYALINALTEEHNIDRVLFLQNGENVEHLGGIRLYQPLLRNPGLIIYD